MSTATATDQSIKLAALQDLINLGQYTVETWWLPRVIVRIWQFDRRTGLPLIERDRRSINFGKQKFVVRTFLITDLSTTTTTTQAAAVNIAGFNFLNTNGLPINLQGLQTPPAVNELVAMAILTGMDSTKANLTVALLDKSFRISNHPFDRNPTLIEKNYFASLANSVQAQQWTYTVPALRRFRIETVGISIVVTAFTNPGHIEAWVQTATPTFVDFGAIWAAAVGNFMNRGRGSGGDYPAGAVLSAQTINAATASADVLVSMTGVEYDA
jgi:hypothetical protein